MDPCRFNDDNGRLMVGSEERVGKRTVRDQQKDERAERAKIKHWLRPGVLLASVFVNSSVLLR